MSVSYYKLRRPATAPARSFVLASVREHVEVLRDANELLAVDLPFGVELDWPPPPSRPLAMVI